MAVCETRHPIKQIFKGVAMENNKTWVLIADSSNAKIFAIYKALIFKEPQNAKNLELIATFDHADSRKKGRDLLADRMGNFGSGTFVEPTDPKAHEAEVFALELVHFLEAARVENKFRDVIYVSSPAFMGLLHMHTPNPLKKMLVQSIEKDYTKHSNEELIKNLLAHW